MKDSVGYNKEMQLPQFEIKGFRVVTKVEQLSTGTVEKCDKDVKYISHLGL